MRQNGVELRNDRGVQISRDGKEVWKVCSVCGNKIDFGDEVLYLFRQHGTPMSTSAHVHYSCIEKLKLDGQAGEVPHYGSLRPIHADKCRCAICGKKGPMYVGLTKQDRCVGFCLECVEDVRLSPAEIEERKIKRATAIPKKVVETKESTILTNEAKNELFKVTLHTRRRLSGKLLSARCHVWDMRNLQENYIELFNSNKWQWERGGLRLTLIVQWTTDVQKQVMEYFDELLSKYDKSGHVRELSEKTA